MENCFIKLNMLIGIWKDVHVIALVWDGYLKMLLRNLRQIQVVFHLQHPLVTDHQLRLVIEWPIIIQNHSNHKSFIFSFELYPVKDLSLQANLKNNSERLIKSIIDLRKKSYIVQEKVEHEIKVNQFNI